MRFKIVHETEYEFSSEVFLEPHKFRFKPRMAPYIKLESFALDISSSPAGLSEQLDPEDNFIHFCWFEGMHKKIIIRAESVIKTQPYNPFNFLIFPPTVNQIPFVYSTDLSPSLGPYMDTVRLDPELMAYAKELLQFKSANTLNFLIQLTSQIHNDFTLEFREEGAPYDPNETFELKRGSCRDLVWMQIQLLRNLGIAVRFVSGYYYVDVEEPRYELHAWSEVFLPGAGWVGFDPSNGIVTEHTHIAVASSSLYQNTMPVSGTIRGDATSELQTSLSIHVLDP